MSVDTEVDKDVLDTLTPEERAAIADSELSPEEVAAMQGIIKEDGSSDNDDDEDDEDPPAGTGESGGDPGAKPAPLQNKETPAPLAADADSEDDPPPASRYQAALPEDYDDRISALKDERKSLDAQFKDGEIEFAEYSEKRDALDERKAELDEIRIKASISADMTTQSQEQAWNSAVTKFTDTVMKSEGIDYRKDLEKQADLDAFVKTLAARPEHADKSFNWFLTEAHKRVKALHGDVSVAKKDDPAPKKVETARRPPVDAIPKTLAQVPGGEGPGDVSGEFADLDALEGMELEVALAKLTPQQRERYQRGE